MRVLVCGSRDWDWPEVIKQELVRLMHDHWVVDVVHGGARGADQQAGVAARSLGLIEEVFEADWNTHGKRAGFLRNKEMMDTHPNLVLAFQRNGSRGTQHTIDLARKAGIPTRVWRVDED